MGDPASDIVDHAIRHAEALADDPNYPWPTARAALGRILEDLERRGSDSASLDRLRQYIAEGDRQSAAGPSDV